MSEKETKNTTVKKSTSQSKTTTKPSTVETSKKTAKPTASADTAKASAKTAAPKKTDSTAKTGKATSTTTDAKPTAKTASQKDEQKKTAAATTKTALKAETPKKAETAKPVKEEAKKPADKPKAQTSKKADDKISEEKPVVAVSEEPKKSTKASKKEDTATVAQSVKEPKQASAKNSDKEELKADKVKDKKSDKPKETEAYDKKTTKKAKIAADASDDKGVSKRNKVASASGDGSAAATVNKKNLTKIIIIGTAVLLVLILVISLVFGLRSCDNANPDKNGDILDPSLTAAFKYKNETSVGFMAEYLGEVERKAPSAVTDNGLVESGRIPKYPTYGSTVNYTAEQKSLVIAEASYLCAKPTRNASGKYDKMDENGYLYLTDGTPVLDANGQPRQLYKHSAAENMYMGNVADDEPRIAKRVTIKPRGYDSYSITGLYAPAGEVIKIEISEEDMEGNSVLGVKGILVHIGQALYNRKANNIWSARNINRMPVILNSMLVTKDNSVYDPERKVYTAYVGSFLGGPIYIHNTSKTTQVTISGGVRYSHFILGYTTREEFEENAKSSAPYFDLEVWEYGVLHSGPKRYAEAFDYDQIYDAAIYWEKVSLVSTQIRKQGIVFLYDPFVAAGAAVAFPGQQSVNCPASWMTASLNYNALVSSGSWGNMHEYNHNFQGWGLPGGGEVTNNAVTLVEYSLFTKVSSSRKIGNTSEGMGGWNRYTSASWATNQICGRRENDLSIYATLLHSFGQDNFIKCCNTSGIDNYFMRWANQVHYDMSYYAELTGKAMSDAKKEQMKALNYPVYVPVASAYQTGRSFVVDGVKQFSDTVQPYVIQYGADFEIDLNKYAFENGYYRGGSIAIPEGFSYQVVKVTNPEHGSIKKTGENMYVYTPSADHMRSGKIIVTLRITKDDGAFEVEDVDLALEFEQSYEMNKTMLERKTYLYTQDTMYQNATDAYDAGYAGYTEVKEGDNINPSQNSNTDIWYSYTEPAPENAVVELRGKLYADDDAKYRIALRGRWNCALYVSLDGGETYELAANVVDKTTGTNFSVAPYKDYELASDSWLYFKIVMITGRSGNVSSFIGLGWGKFTPAAPALDANGEPVLDANGEPVVYPETVNVTYATAYRSTYVQKNEKYETDYFYTRPHTYNYADNKVMSDGQIIVANQCTIPKLAPNWGSGTIDCIIDGKTGTFVHTAGGVSANSPFIVVLDLGAPKVVNRLTINTQNRPNGDWKTPTAMNLYGSLDGVNYTLIQSYTGQYRSTTLNFDFDETELRYYKVEITASYSTHIIISEMKLWHMFEINGGKHLRIDSDEYTFKGDWTAQSEYSMFGKVFVANSGATMKFEFEGTRLGLCSSVNHAGKFEVYIDGVKVESIELKESSEMYNLSYLSGELEEGKHSVEIKCVENNANIGSVVVW